MTTPNERRDGIGEDGFLDMLERRLGSRGETSLERITVTFEPTVVARLNAELERLIRSWAAPVDQDWWFAHGLEGLRSVFIEAAVILWLEAVADDE